MIWVVGKEKTGQINKGRSVFTQLSFFALSSFQLFWDSIYNHYTHRVSFWLYNKGLHFREEQSPEKYVRGYIFGELFIFKVALDRCYNLGTHCVFVTILRTFPKSQHHETKCCVSPLSC